jgi:hypothetical protein
VEKSEGVVVEILPILGEPATAVEPGDGALNDPALGFHDKAFDVVGAFDDFDLQVWHDSGDAVLEDRAGVGAVGEQLPQEWELSKQSGQQQNTAVAILNVCRSHQRVQQQPQFVDQDVAFLAFDQLACIEATRVDGSPPFSALFTL